MFVVAGVSGNTGSVVAETLLERGKKVRVLVRDAAKAARFREKGAEVHVAELDSLEAMTAALKGAEGAYLLLPPPSVATGILAANARRASLLAEAIRQSGVPHVVLLSSIGAQLPEGTGPIRSVHDAEKKLDATGVARTYVRAAYFQENWGAVLAPALGDGVLPTPLLETRKIPMVATRDIGTTAAEALLDPAQGRRIIELAGPEDYSPADVATALTTLAAKPVRYAALPYPAFVPALTSMGVPAELAELYLEMNIGFNEGRIGWQKTDTITKRGTTSLTATLEALVKGARKSH